jgi:TIR domain
MPSDETARSDTPPNDPPASRDIFLSYARPDQADAEWIVEVLTQRGWSVWSDSHLLGGQEWKAEIERALDGARCVVVLWSTASTESHWVLDEAADGQKRGILVPARLDGVAVPLGFRQIQTIDLARTGDARDRSIDALAAAVANVLGRRRVEPPKRGRLARLLRVGVPPIVAIVPFALAVLASVYRVAETGVDLEATAREVSFVSEKEQDLVDLSLVSLLEAGGLESIQIPRTRQRSEQLLTASEGRGLAIRIVPGDSARQPGTMTLPPFAIARGAHVTLAGDAGDRYRVSLTGSPLPIALNVQGPVRTALSERAPESVDFGAPKPIVLKPREDASEIGIRPSNRATRVVASPLEISMLSLARIDQTVETGRTDVSRVSTIVSGTLRLDALGRRERTIAAGERLQFAESRGAISNLQLSPDGLLLRFQGRVRRMEACLQNVCESLMPAYVESFAARHLPWSLALAAVYLLYLLAFGRRWLKTSRHLV